MTEILIPPGRALNAEEQDFRERFERAIYKIPFTLREDEKFAQWLYTEDDYRFYNPMYFTSNYGYTISVFGTGIKILKANLKTGGWCHDIAAARWTPYVKSYLPRWERDAEKGYVPQYYYYLNPYPKSRGLADKMKQVVVHKVVALYFLPDGHLVIDGKHEVHHKRPFDWDKPSEYSNRADNLQILLEDDVFKMSEAPEKKAHSFVHRAAKDTDPEHWIDRVERASAPDVPNLIFVEPGGLERFIVEGLKSMDPGAPIAASMKDEDGSAYMNIYGTAEGVKALKD